MEHRMILMDENFKPIAMMTARRKDSVEEQEEKEGNLGKDISLTCYDINN